jgi:tRNA-Thr(GGU) m(6)t(6)A37 methyltransferase TsaA
MNTIPMNIIARMKSDFSDKFGIPRQSGLVQELSSAIVFEPEYRNKDALRGLEDFSHLWIIWHFSEAVRDEWSPTVRPPRLGGNTRMGVFATRSPFRPNPIGLSCVKIHSIDLNAPEGPVIHVLGADLLDGTPILDIKPYIPYCDAHTEALGGFTTTASNYILTVQCPEPLLEQFPTDKLSALMGVLSHDPRPSYQKDPDRIYGLDFAGFNVQFSVSGELLTVLQIDKM